MRNETEETSFDEEWEALLRDFRDQLDITLAQIAGLLNGFSFQGAFPQQQLQKLQRHAHWLAGSGGSFGYSEVTETSRKLENQCNLLLQGRIPWDRSGLESLIGLFQEVQSAKNKPDRSSNSPAQGVSPHPF